jgi:2-polyprenyl-3-methyl-5-hydroxy-6-metoxy-1,4-benzoquinol methylase
MVTKTTQTEIRRVCSVCNQENYDYWYKPSQSPGPIVQCKGCGFVYVNPIQSDKALIQEGPVLDDRPAYLLESSDLNDIQGSWEQPIIEKYLNELHAKKLNAQEALGHINSVVSKRGAMLDFGCFCGVFLSAAAQDGWDCYGLEPLVMPAIYARGHFGLQVTTGTLREDTFPPNFFDVVTAFQVFEHLIHPEEEIEKIRKILKPGGLLLIEVPNIDTIMVKFLRAKHRHFVQDHVSFFSSKTLSELLSRMGFQTRKVYYPTRILSLHHFVWWLGKYNQRLSNSMTRLLPDSDHEKTVRINLGDIVAVIAEKK